jgi:tetratricopeptide (TPR) repeat protein
MLASRIPATALFCLLFLSPALHAQDESLSADEWLARGDSLLDALEPAGALEAFRTAYASEQTYAAMWKFANAQVEVAKQLEGTDQTALRDSLYSVARLYADAAVRTDSLDAEGHFMVSLVLGRLSRTRGGKERVRFAEVIFDAASRAVELDPSHDGAHHVLGAWHAEVKRLSGLTRFFAKTFFGAGFFDRASWESSVEHLERSVALRPDYLYHRLELAEVYLDLERPDDARAQLEALLALPPTSDVMDPSYQAAARGLLGEIASTP